MVILTLTASAAINPIYLSLDRDPVADPPVLKYVQHEKVEYRA